eukprot:6786850-Lingulodinium_polyedra.AAC.1
MKTGIKNKRRKKLVQVRVKVVVVVRPDSLDSGAVREFQEFSKGRKGEIENSRKNEEYHGRG